MALTVTFQIGAPCSGGNHFGVRATVTQTGQKIDVPLVKSDFKEPTAEEYAEFVRMLMNVFYQQMPNATPSEMKTRVDAKTLNLTV